MRRNLGWEAHMKKWIHRRSRGKTSNRDEGGIILELPNDPVFALPKEKDKICFYLCCGIRMVNTMEKSARIWSPPRFDCPLGDSSLKRSKTACGESVRCLDFPSPLAAINGPPPGRIKIEPQTLARRGWAGNVFGEIECPVSESASSRITRR